VLRGSKEVSGEAIEAVNKTAAAVIKSTAEAGGELASAAATGRSRLQARSLNGCDSGARRRDGYDCWH
jgi:hypothetical protein